MRARRASAGGGGGLLVDVEWHTANLELDPAAAVGVTTDAWRATTGQTLPLLEQLAVCSTDATARVFCSSAVPLTPPPRSATDSARIARAMSEVARAALWDCPQLLGGASASNEAGLFGHRPLAAALHRLVPGESASEAIDAWTQTVERLAPLGVAQILLASSFPTVAAASAEQRLMEYEQTQCVSQIYGIQSRSSQGRVRQTEELLERLRAQSNVWLAKQAAAEANYDRLQAAYVALLESPLPAVQTRPAQQTALV
jgi:hypothetical protein